MEENKASPQAGRKLINCVDCGKPATYNRTRGNICWKCKDLRTKNSNRRSVKKPVRCPTCGCKLTIVPCIACEMGRNKPKSSSSSPGTGVQGNG
jgi:hypothetical protein